MKTSTLTLLLICLTAGCDRGPRMCIVAGNISYQGKVVEEGEIIFADANQQSPTAAGRIELGKYSVNVLPGEKSVRITGNKKTGRMVQEGMAGGVPDRVDLIPAKYNTSTTLLRTIPPQERISLDFELD